MSDQISDSHNLENTGSAESSPQEQILEDSTFTPESRVETTGSFEQSEAIERELSTLVDTNLSDIPLESDQAAASPVESTPAGEDSSEAAFKFFEPAEQASNEEPVMETPDGQADPGIKFFEPASPDSVDDQAYKFFNDPEIQQTPADTAGKIEFKIGASVESISQTAAAAILGKAATDSEFRTLLLENPEQALQDYDLSTEERAALSALDSDKLSGAMEQLSKSAGRDPGTQE